MLAKGEAFVSLSPPFWTTIEIDRAVAVSYLKAEASDDFKKHAAEAGSLLAPILEGNIEGGIQTRLQQRATDKSATASAETYEKELREKIASVKNFLYNDHLQKRYDLKKSSKAPSFTDIDWDIKTKYADAKMETLAPFPYATCRISFQREFGGQPLNFFNAFDSVQINFSVDEIEYLRRTLTTIEERLKSIERELKSGNS